MIEPSVPRTTAASSDRERQLLIQLALDLVNTCSDAIIGQDLAGRIISWNKSAAALYGFTPAEAIGQTLDIITPPDQRAALAKRLDQIKQGLTLPHYETARRRQNGSIVNVRVALAPIHNDAGTLIGWSDIARDITNQTNLAQESIRSNERLRTLFERAPVGFVLGDEQNRIVDINQMVLKITGYTRAELLGHELGTILVPEDAPRQRDVLRRRLAGEEVGTQTYGVVRKDGQIIYVASDVESLTIQNEKFAIGVFTDVTERRLYQTEFTKRAGELERLSRLMIGREAKMIELKKEVAILKNQLGKK